jgi:hypothetical protein
VAAADPQLAEEQRHLDRTFAAHDALLDAAEDLRPAPEAGAAEAWLAGRYASGR